MDVRFAVYFSIEARKIGKKRVLDAVFMFCRVSENNVNLLTPRPEGKFVFKAPKPGRKMNWGAGRVHRGVAQNHYFTIGGGLFPTVLETFPPPGAVPGWTPPIWLEKRERSLGLLGKGAGGVLLGGEPARPDGFSRPPPMVSEVFPDFSPQGRKSLNEHPNSS